MGKLFESIINTFLPHSLSFFSFNILRESKHSYNNKYESLYSRTREVEITKFLYRRYKKKNSQSRYMSHQCERDLILPFISSSIIFLSFGIDPPLPSFFLRVFTPIQSITSSSSFHSMISRFSLPGGYFNRPLESGDDLAHDRNELIHLH